MSMFCWRCNWCKTVGAETSSAKRSFAVRRHETTYPEHQNHIVTWKGNYCPICHSNVRRTQPAKMDRATYEELMRVFKGKDRKGKGIDVPRTRTWKCQRGHFFKDEEDSLVFMGDPEEEFLWRHYFTTGSCPNAGNPTEHPCRFCDEPQETTT